MGPLVREKSYNNKKPVNFLICPNLFGEFQGLEGQLTGWW